MALPPHSPLPAALAAVRRRIIAIVQGSGRHGGTILGVCCAAILWSGMLISLSVQRQQVIHAAMQNTANLARALEENTIRSLTMIDQTLLHAAAALQRDPAGFDLSRWARDSAFLTDPTFQLSIIDKDGYLQASTVDSAAGRLWLGDRAHFLAHANGGPDALFVSQPVVGRVSGRWSIQLTRRIEAADGSFAGVVVASLDPVRLSRFYRAPDLGLEGVTLLVGLDGVVRARAAAGGMKIGISLAGGEMLKAHALAPTGHYTVESRVDGVRRIYAYREVSGFPLIAVVGVSLDEILADYSATPETVHRGGQRGDRVSAGRDRADRPVSGAPGAHARGLGCERGIARETVAATGCHPAEHGAGPRHGGCEPGHSCAQPPPARIDRLAGRRRPSRAEPARRHPDALGERRIR